MAKTFISPLKTAILANTYHPSYDPAPMGKTREIKKRIKAVGNIKRITKTMQMIATAKFSAANARTTAAKPYTAALFQLVSELAGSLTDVSHPLVDAAGSKPRTGPELTLVITSDRGLCGPYNGTVLRNAAAFLRANPAAMNGQIELVGKKGLAFCKFNGIKIARGHTQFGDKPTYEAVEALAQDYIDRFIKGEISAVRVVSTRFISAGKQTAQVQQILPFKTPEKAATAEKKAVPQYEFSPAAKELLDDLLPAAVKATLFQLFQEAVVSEHVARMIAMKSATDNSGKSQKRLTRVYNRARQAQITTELTEIISGAAALD